MSKILDVSDSTFKSEVLEAGLPVFVWFWAPWSGACKYIWPLVEEVVQDYLGRIKAFKLDTDQNPSIASEYDIRHLPTFIIFKNREPVETLQKAEKVTKTTLSTTLQKYIQHDWEV
jgi:thioredoxin 1